MKKADYVSQVIVNPIIPEEMNPMKAVEQLYQIFKKLKGWDGKFRSVQATDDPQYVFSIMMDKYYDSVRKSGYKSDQSYWNYNLNTLNLSCRKRDDEWILCQFHYREIVTQPYHDIDVSRLNHIKRRSPKLHDLIIHFLAVLIKDYHMVNESSVIFKGVSRKVLIKKLKEYNSKHKTDLVIAKLMLDVIITKPANINAYHSWEDFEGKGQKVSPYNKIVNDDPREFNFICYSRVIDYDEPIPKKPRDEYETIMCLNDFIHFTTTKRYARFYNISEDAV